METVTGLQKAVRWSKRKCSPPPTNWFSPHSRSEELKDKLKVYIFFNLTLRSSRWCSACSNSCKLRLTFIPSLLRRTPKTKCEIYYFLLHVFECTRARNPTSIDSLQHAPTYETDRSFNSPTMLKCRLDRQVGNLNTLVWWWSPRHNLFRSTPASICVFTNLFAMLHWPPS